jgi:CHAT domain-containing protein/tetratricopeptide (TPR) repeat protein
MSGKVFFIPLSFLLIISFKIYSPGPIPIQKILLFYGHADRLYNSSNSNMATDSAAIREFKDVIEALATLPKQRLTDSLAYQACYKLGILYEVYKNYPRATATYLRAYHFAINPSDQFRMEVFAGTGYYYQNIFDSASYFLLRAAETSGESFPAEDRVRLFNTLGVLYYDNGNYLQSKNYFSQALQLIENNSPLDRLGTYSIQLNMATCFYKLGNYQQALTIYQKALGYHLVPDPLYMNMGRAYAGLHQYEAALSAFKKVKITELPGVLNEMARTAMDAGNYDSAGHWLNRYRLEKKSLHSNILDDGVNELYAGDLDILIQNPASALRHFQEALNVFSGNFTERDTRKNPRSFTGSFAYYRLFEVLDKKAAAWEMSFKKNARPEDLQSAYDAYQSTISLLSYIEKSYEMDDAKLLLKEKSGEVFTHAMEVCFQLNTLFPEKGFLEEAFLISEKNKASVMSSQIRERKFLNVSGAEANLAGQERNIKFNIARLNTKLDEGTDARQLQTTNEQKSVYETQLVNLRRKMEGNKRFYQLKYSDDFPTVQELQQSMNGSQALISFYNEPEKIQVFVLTKNALKHVQLDRGTAIRGLMQEWIQILQTAENGSHINTKTLKAGLYASLIKPIIGLAGDQEDWIIIPDGLFFQLPLESLPGRPEGGLILEDHMISYQFSARFVLENNRSPADPVSEKAILSFAPFSQRTVEIKKDTKLWLEKLPYSKDEIGALSGMRYADQQATKTIFIKNLNRYPVIHLATHAFTNLENPSASFIAFYPLTNNRGDDFLFLDEIYSLSMDSCQMIVMSACETGRGELVRNEGVMSFARAFLYAGCPSTVNTLWKADDRSTAEIFKLFYKYLETGDSKSKALQKAKLEFIRSNPLSRDPAYWSHIVVTGDPVALYKKKQPWFWAVLGISFGTILWVLFSRRKGKKVDAFHS